MSESTNGDKAKHGANAQSAISHMLDAFSSDIVLEFETDYRKDKPGFSNIKPQFYAPFKIRFKDGDEWLLYSTTSYRSDRIKGLQWDAANLKDINERITKAYLIYSDDISDKELAEFNKARINLKNYYSAIDDLLRYSEIRSLIHAKGGELMSAGKLKDLLGRSYEDEICVILNSKENLAKLNGLEKSTDIFNSYEVFLKIMNKLYTDTKTIVEINATSDKKKIGKLPSGGNPKTDVLVEIKFSDGTQCYRTISAKKSSSRKVSVHEYSADDFANVLDANNKELKSLLNDFQQAGNKRDFGDANNDKLTNALIPYRSKLNKWVLGGYGGNYKNVNQCADYILIYSVEESKTEIYSLDEYLNKLSNVAGFFGTPFSWTYPSKNKRKKIQLKLPINF